MDLMDLRLLGAVARFDFSWGNPEYHQGTLENLKAAVKTTKKLCAVRFFFSLFFFYIYLKNIFITLIVIVMLKHFVLFRSCSTRWDLNCRLLTKVATPFLFRQMALLFWHQIKNRKLLLKFSPSILMDYLRFALYSFSPFLFWLWYCWNNNCSVLIVDGTVIGSGY